MRIEEDQEIICGFNIIETVLNSRPKSAKALFVLDSKSNSRIKNMSSKAQSSGVKVSLKDKDFFLFIAKIIIIRDWLYCVIKEKQKMNLC